MTRVADFAQHALLQSFIQNTQSRVFETQVQIASGRTAQRFSKIAESASRLLNLENARSRSGEFLKNIDLVDSRLQTVETNTRQILNAATDFRTLLVNALNLSNAADLNLPTEATNVIGTVTGLLNVKQDGRFLFAGSRTDTRPVDPNDPDYFNPVPGAFPTSADTAYYQGDAQKLSVRVDEQFQIQYGITADDPAFEEVLRALKLVENAGVPPDRARLEEALRVITQAIDSLPDLIGRIGTSRRSLDQVSEKHRDFQLYADQTIGDIENVDVTQAMPRLTEDQIALEASFATIARLSTLSLTQFLR